MRAKRDILGPLPVPVALSDKIKQDAIQSVLGLSWKGISKLEVRAMKKSGIPVSLLKML